MARQSTTPMAFPMTTRKDNAVTMTSGEAGKVVLVDFIPVLRGDTVSGRFGIDIDLAEMPRPLLNAVTANVQAWFVPKSAYPQFAGYDEFMNSYQGKQITALGAADRDPPEFFSKVLTTGVDRDSVRQSDLFKTLGLHLPQYQAVNMDLADAYNLVYNFRLAAHSSRLTRREYSAENLLNSVAFGPAFWPTGRFSNVVPDYERALVVGALDLDVSAGRLPVTGIATALANSGGSKSLTGKESTGETVTYDEGEWIDNMGNQAYLNMKDGLPQIFAEMQNQRMTVTLADINMAQTTQAFAKVRAAMAGNDPTGFASDDAIVAEMMQGFSVPEDLFKRPWLLDNKRVVFGMNERHATDAANLDQSVSKGRASASLSINLPKQDVGGYIIFTVEVVPERIYEAQLDPAIAISGVAGFPDALRDAQRIEPVDDVTCGRIDARHSTPGQVYGYEPMNDKWNREFTRLGGDYFQADPANPWTEQRSAIWQANIVDPEFTRDHYLCPEDFPKYVFADTEAPAFELVARHSVAIRGITQIGDVLSENSDDYEAVQAEATGL